MKIRINKIECRVSLEDENTWEIVSWFPNLYYKKESELVSHEGYQKEYDQKGDWGLVKEGHSLHSSCFQHEETCIVIANLTYDKKEGGTELKSIGTRILSEIDEDNLQDFMEVYRLADKKITQFFQNSSFRK